jgi:two-component system NtrC family sensor kinase
MAQREDGPGRGASQRQSGRRAAKAKGASGRSVRGPSASEIELARALEESLERQAATAEILKVIARSPSDVQPVFDAIANRSKQLIGGFSCTVFRLIDGIVHLVAYTSVGEAADAVLKAAFPRPVGEMSLFDMAKGQDVFEEADAEDNPDARLRELARARGFRSTLFARLMSKGTVIGLIAVTRTQPGSFDPHHVQLLRTFADQAVIAIENARLFNETQEALERQTATADILKVIASSPSDVQPVFDAIAASANRLIGGFSATVMLFIDDMLHLVALTSTNAAADQALKASFPRPLAEFPPFELVRGGETVEFPDTEAESVPPLNRELARLRGYRSMVFTPLMSNGAPVGILSVTRVRTGSFPAHHVQLLRTFADQAVIAIENTRLFEEVQARTHELSQSLEDLRTAQDRLVQTEKLASLGQLTAGIAHEIKNPLNFVNNFSSLSAELIDELKDVLKQETLTGKGREELDELTGLLQDNLGKVVQHGKRADSIVKNMLQHSREGSGERRSADINALVGESLNLAYHGARAEKAGFNIKLEHDLDPDAGELELYPQEMTRALLNLISNGFYAASKKAAADGKFAPVLSAATKNLGKAVEIRIRDNGTGIPPEVREKMFNPFFTTKPTGEGTGLGLSMTHDIIVKQHGGRIDVATEPGAFTEFIITLPRKNGAADGSRPDRI